MRWTSPLLRLKPRAGAGTTRSAFVASAIAEPLHARLEAEWTARVDAVLEAAGQPDPGVDGAAARRLAGSADGRW
jgi:hypothetical protein